MSYIKAKEVLPSEIIEIIQKYIDGEYIYIPKRENNRSEWGTRNNTRKEINTRNHNIYFEYINGANRNELADKYFLSKKSIDRIILKEKSK
ncbi:MAG: CD3324 family protein [Romboutsia sp.]|uniref:CD3324 family protein n=1 Tax=Romboutsia sp. TaxID=1965302 RepID=UPI003F3D7127